MVYIKIDGEFNCCIEKIYCDVYSLLCCKNNLFKFLKKI